MQPTKIEGNYRVTYFVPGDGINHRWFDSRLKAILFRLCNGWVGNGFQTKQDVLDMDEWLRQRELEPPDYETGPDGRY